MTPIAMYRCDICGFSYDTSQEAVACEAKGRPEIPAWANPGRAWAFGESGVQETVLHDVFGEWELRGRDPHDPQSHVLLARIDYVSISHNLVDLMNVPIRALDPMRGLDFLRYVSVANVRAHALRWREACLAYGVDPDPVMAGWADRLEPEKMAAFCEALR